MCDDKLDRLNDAIRDTCYRVVKEFTDFPSRTRDIPKIVAELNAKIAQLCLAEGALEPPVVEVVQIPDGLQVRMIKAGRPPPCTRYRA